MLSLNFLPILVNDIVWQGSRMSGCYFSVSHKYQIIKMRFCSVSTLCRMRWEAHTHSYYCVLDPSVWWLLQTRVYSSTGSILQRAYIHTGTLLSSSKGYMWAIWFYYPNLCARSLENSYSNCKLSLFHITIGWKFIGTDKFLSSQHEPINFKCTHRVEWCHFRQPTDTTTRIKASNVVWSGGGSYWFIKLVTISTL